MGKIRKLNGQSEIEVSRIPLIGTNKRPDKMSCLTISHGEYFIPFCAPFNWISTPFAGRKKEKFSHS